MKTVSWLTVLRWVLAGFLLVLGVAVFAVRLQHDGPYAVPGPGAFWGGLGALTLGAILAWAGAPRLLSWAALALTPVVTFPALYGTVAELEEVVSLYAKDSQGRPAELRLWIIDRADGAWVGMGGSKAVEHALDGAELKLLRDGQLLCVTPVLYEDRPTVTEIHGLKVAKYAVARAAGRLGLYPLEAPETAVALRLDPCQSP